MALIRIPGEEGESRTISATSDIRAFLAARGIDYEKWEPQPEVPAASSSDEILEAYAPKIGELKGRGLFHIHPAEGPVFAIEVERGDLIRVPKGTHHWFDLCGDRRIRAVRLFQDPSGWTPHYTGSGVDTGFQPVCFGAA